MNSEFILNQEIDQTQQRENESGDKIQNKNDKEYNDDDGDDENVLKDLKKQYLLEPKIPKEIQAYSLFVFKLLALTIPIIKLIEQYDKLFKLWERQFALYLCKLMEMLSGLVILRYSIFTMLHAYSGRLDNINSIHASESSANNTGNQILLDVLHALIKNKESRTNSDTDNKALSVLRSLACPLIIFQDEVAIALYVVVSFGLLIGGPYYTRILFDRLAKCDTFTFMTNIDDFVYETKLLVCEQTKLVSRMCRIHVDENIFAFATTSGLVAKRQQRCLTLSTDCKLINNVDTSYRQASLVFEQDKFRQKSYRQFFAPSEACKTAHLSRALEMNEKFLISAQKNPLKFWPLNRSQLHRYVITKRFTQYHSFILTPFVSITALVLTVFMAYTHVLNFSSLSMSSQTIKLNREYKGNEQGYNYTTTSTNSRTNNNATRQSVSQKLSLLQIVTLTEFIFVCSRVNFLFGCGIILFLFILVDYLEFIRLINIQFDTSIHAIQECKQQFVERHNDNCCNLLVSSLANKYKRKHLETKDLMNQLANIDKVLLSSYIQLQILRKQLKPVLKLGSVIYKSQIYYSFGAIIVLLLTNTVIHSQSIQSIILPTVSFLFLLNTVMPLIAAFSRKCEISISNRVLSMMANIADLNHIVSIQSTPSLSNIKQTKTNKLHLFFDTQTMSFSAFNPLTLHLWRKAIKNLDLLRDSFGVKVFDFDISRYEVLIETNVWVVSMAALFVKQRLQVI